MKYSIILTALLMLASAVTAQDKPTFDFNHKEFVAKKNTLHDEEIEFLHDLVNAIDKNTHDVYAWNLILARAKKYPQTVVIENIKFFNRNKLDKWLDKSFEENTFKDFLKMLDPPKPKINMVRFYFSLLNPEQHGEAMLCAQALKEAGKVGNVEDEKQKKFIMKRPGLFGLE